MDRPKVQTELFPGSTDQDKGSVFVNERCRVRTQDGHRVVLVSGVVLAQYTVGDRMAEAHAMVSLVEQGFAEQLAVARAFGCTSRTVRRQQERFEAGGLAALGRHGGYPKGRPRLRSSRTRLVGRLKAEGVSNRAIAQRVGVSEKAVRKLLRRLGWRQPEPSQLELPVGAEDEAEAAAEDERSGADSNLSAPVGAPPLLAQPEPLPAPSAPAPAADPNLSAPVGAPPLLAQPEPVPAPSAPALAADPNLSAPVGTSSVLAQPEPLPAPSAPTPAADPNLSAPHAETEPSAALSALTGATPSAQQTLAEDGPVSFDSDPGDRRYDRLLACLGMLDDAAPLFRPGWRVPGAGVLLALPALIESGVIEVAREVYGSIGPAFYGLRTSIVAMILMALLRIKRPEGLKERPPDDLGRILGLDRAPEVKTLRRKLARLAAFGRAAEFGRALAKRRVASRGNALGFLYVDGHVRAYHGKHPIPKAHVARMRISMPATTDYWVGDQAGEPLFLVTADANAGLAAMLPNILAEMRTLLGQRRLTVVFDRGGWSPQLFQQIIEAGFDILTYRKGPSPRVPKRLFHAYQHTVEGATQSYQLADQNVRLQLPKRRQLRLRQVTRLAEDGRHQTPIVTSRRDLAPLEVALRMFDRWRQENFFKYLREEYALDALIEYAVVPDDPTREVPNPARKAIEAELHEARVLLANLQAQYGEAALDNPESRRPSMRGFKIAHGRLGRALRTVLKRVTTLETRRAKMPTHIPVRNVVDGEVVKLAPERQHLSSLMKMVAYQAESELVRLIIPHYKRVEDEGRTLVQNALLSSADIEVTDTELRVRLAPLSSPHRTAAIAALCNELNRQPVRFPGAPLTLRFSVASPGQG